MISGLVCARSRPHFWVSMLFMQLIIVWSSTEGMSLRIARFSCQSGDWMQELLNGWDGWDSIIIDYVWSSQIFTCVTSLDVKTMINLSCFSLKQVLFGCPPMPRFKWCDHFLPYACFLPPYIHILYLWLKLIVNVFTPIRESCWEFMSKYLSECNGTFSSMMTDVPVFSMKT